MNQSNEDTGDSQDHRFIETLRALHGNEDGLVSFINLFVMLGILLGITAVANIAFVTRDKMESQNAADAIAQSAAGTQMARGMNAITAANHLIGEAQAIVVLHHAYGGDALERGRGDTTPSGLRRGLRTAYQAARSASPSFLKPQHYASIGASVNSEAALGDSFKRLKQLTRRAYWWHFSGALMYQSRWAWVQWIGIQIMRASRAFVNSVHREWKILKRAEDYARSSIMRNKANVRDRIIPTMYRYSLMQRDATPIRMTKTAQEIGEAYYVKGSLFPQPRNSSGGPRLRLPVAKEPAGLQGSRLSRSQLVRASVPWIQHWRIGVLRKSQHLFLSQFSKHYHKYTQEMSLSLAGRAKQQRGIHLLVLDQANINQGRKGFESWTKVSGSRQADRMFSVMGFSLRKPPFVVGPGVYSKGVKDGLVTFAQSMIYNANPHRPGSGTEYQSNTGWDTLNWVHGRIPEWKAGESRSSRPAEPRISLNWQSMLTPSTRIEEPGRWMRGAVGEVLGRTELSRSISRTH